jgi:hypothetical protein
VPSFGENALRFSFLGLRAGGGEGQSKNPWNALLSPRMLAQGSAQGNASPRELEIAGCRHCRKLRRWREKIPGLVPNSAPSIVNCALLLAGSKGFSCIRK